VAVATALAYLTFAGTAGAFGPEPAPTGEAPSAETAPSLAPEPVPVAEQEPGEASPEGAQGGETVVLEQYQSPESEPQSPESEPQATVANLTEVDTHPAAQEAPSAKQTDDRNQASSLGAATHHDPAAARPPELKMLRRVVRATFDHGTVNRSLNAWYRERNYQYHSLNHFQKRISLSHSRMNALLAPRSQSSVLVQIRGQIRPEEAQHQPPDRTNGAPASPSQCKERQIHEIASSALAAAARLVGPWLESRPAPPLATFPKRIAAKVIVDMWTHHLVRSAELIDCESGQAVRSGRPSSPGRNLASPNRSRETRPPSSPGADRAGEPAAGFGITVAGAPGGGEPSIGPGKAKFLRTDVAALLGRVLPKSPIRHGPEAADQLTDTRRLVQIGLLLGMAYVAFLTLWFWRTRLRGNRSHGGGRL
jgi:hypothetical protein